jgi:uncharacterized protein (TIGR03437 family)
VAIPVAISATGAPGSAVAPEEIVSLYGANFATSSSQSYTMPPPTSLGGVSVTVADSAGTSRQAGLYFVSPAQINLLIPAGTPAGVATVMVNGTPSGTAIAPIKVNVAAVAPGIFTASGDGTGMPAAQLVRVRADGSQTLETLTAAGIRIGGDTVYLVLYGTGIRNRTSTAAVVCGIAGQPVKVAYAGPQGVPGLDQVNLLLPALLAGTGAATVTMTVDGAAANPVTVTLL